MNNVKQREQGAYQFGWQLVLQNTMQSVDMYGVPNCCRLDTAHDHLCCCHILRVLFSFTAQTCLDTIRRVRVCRTGCEHKFELRATTIFLSGRMKSKYATYERKYC